MSLRQKFENWLFRYPIPEGFHRADAPEWVQRLTARWSRARRRDHEWLRTALRPEEVQAFIAGVKALTLSAQEAAEAFRECGKAIERANRELKALPAFHAPKEKP